MTGWAAGTFPWLDDEGDRPAPTVRVIVDNDFAGDPDDLFQVVHHLLSPGVDLRGIVASHLAPGDGFDPGPDTATHAADKLRELFGVAGFDGESLIWLGSEDGLVDASTPQPCEAVDRIVAEAMRDDERPLYYCAGGGLTDIVSAWLVEPRIAERLTVIWIGGPEHSFAPAAPEGVGVSEYNLKIDVTAARVLFNDSDLPLWQVPRDAYRQCLVSNVELRRRVAPKGELGRYLADSITGLSRLLAQHGFGHAETYCMGDQPLVLLSALQSRFEPDPSSSSYVVVPAPRLDEKGEYEDAPGGRDIRVWTSLDLRLMFEDFFLKLDEHAAWHPGA
ncbi:nucleoside hydrolase [Nocardioides sp. GY 10127]|uniref:nucleoside hydrolase n=1 Tax=Nocardioides sp. GY 10127 TaxID=2569762 RepID=UPI0010A8E59E|nr:nucleoside hydrolase [Nocardioides sp. GY 10127]TIC79109.1 nucleoside hydrolase [Nocardioides sp. GY 10127]